MNVLVISIILAILVATYLSSMNLALLGFSRSAMQRYLIKKRRPAAADWLYDQLDEAALATALLRTLARVAVYILILAAVIEFRAQPAVSWLDLVISGLIAAVLIWLATTVFSSAIARHMGTRLLGSSLAVLRIITVVCRPLGKLGMLVDRLFEKIAGPRDQDEGEAELLESIEDVQREGSLDLQAAEILENVVEFTNTEVSDIMTPRLDIEGIEYTDDLGTIREFIIHAGHSRIPIYRNGVDNILGILYVKDLVRYLGQDAPQFKLEPILRQPIVVPETKPVKDLLRDFQHSEVHMAIVVDEYGSTAGLVTIEDVLEEIVGEIRDEHEPQGNGERELVLIDDTHAEVDGRLRVDELNDRMNLNLPDEGDFDTVAGLMLWHFGRVPEEGESFEINNVRLTTIAATPTYVKRIGIELLQQPTPVEVVESLSQNAK